MAKRVNMTGSVLLASLSMVLSGLPTSASEVPVGPTAVNTSFITELGDPNPSGLEILSTDFMYGFLIPDTVELNDQLVFSATASDTGTEPWVTDGTAEGTSLLKDIRTGSNGSSPSGFTVLGNRIVFSAFDDVNGSELWVTDGTSAGTSLLKDIRAGSTGSSPSYFHVIGNRIVFTASDATNGSELWVTDGTAEGTSLLKDIRAGSPSSSPYYFHAFGDRALFSAYDDALGRELWISDGTPSGTSLLKDINNGQGGSEPQGFVELNDKVFFTASDGSTGAELWVTDGTTDGTMLVKDIRPGTNGSYPQRPVASGDRLFMVASDGTAGDELWVTDGTTDGTLLVKDIRPGINGASLYTMQASGDGVVFVANDGTTGAELWFSDGTSGGTNVVDLRPGSEGSQPTLLTRVGNRVVMAFTTGSQAQIYAVADDGTQSVVNDSDGSPLVMASDGSYYPSYSDGGFPVWGESILMNRETRNGTSDIVRVVFGGRIRFDANGGQDDTLPAALEIAVDQSPTVPETQPRRADYVFASWNTAVDGSGTSYAPGDPIGFPTNGSLTLYAQWDHHCSVDTSHPFTDVGDGRYYAAGVTCLHGMGITHGTSPTTFSPDAGMTRGQMAAVLARTLLAVGDDSVCQGTHPFTDVAGDRFYHHDVGCLYRLGITTGTSPTTFSPEQFVTRGQMAAFLSRLHGELIGGSCQGEHNFTDVSESAFYADAVGCIATLGVTTGTSSTTFSPDQIVTRGQMAAFLTRLYLLTTNMT